MNKKYVYYTYTITCYWWPSPFKIQNHIWSDSIKPTLQPSHLKPAGKRCLNSNIPMSHSYLSSATLRVVSLAPLPLRHIGFFFQCLYVECDSTLPFMGIETFDRWCAHTHTMIRYASGGAFMNKFGSVFFSNRNFFSRSVTCRVTLGVFGIKSVYFSGRGQSNRLLKAISY